MTTQIQDGRVALSSKPLLSEPFTLEANQRIYTYDPSVFRAPEMDLGFPVIKILDLQSNQEPQVLYFKRDCFTSLDRSSYLVCTCPEYNKIKNDLETEFDEDDFSSNVLSCSHLKDLRGDFARPFLEHVINKITLSQNSNGTNTPLPLKILFSCEGEIFPETTLDILGDIIKK